LLGDAHKISFVCHQITIRGLDDACAVFINGSVQTVGGHEDGVALVEACYFFYRFIGDAIQMFQHFSLSVDERNPLIALRHQSSAVVKARSVDVFPTFFLRLG